MTSGNKMILYEDDLGFLPAGQVFYPESLRQISPHLSELNRESMRDLEIYSANIRLELDSIIGYFRSLHNTHRAALAVYELYRAEGCQYCLYLRSFEWAGFLLGSEMYLSAWDRDFQRFLKAALPPSVASLSFVNTLDYYPGRLGEEAMDMYRAAIPSLRVLSHNWKEVVSEVIRGARLVVLNARGQSVGVTYEVELLSECGMQDRTIVIGSKLRDKGMASIGRFGSVIDVGEDRLTPDSDDAGRFAEAIRSLSTDNFRQTNQVRDLSELPCWVLDRNIAAAARQFGADELAGVPYDCYLPSSLANNWMIFTERYPQMFSQWQEIEATWESDGRAGGQRLSRVLDMAVKVFWVAVTLERYYEMAIALSTIGMAHRAITGKFELIVPCYAHAAECARWSGDSALSTFLTDAHSVLEEEAAASPDQAPM